jgi:hypothetical protein
MLKHGHIVIIDHVLMPKITGVRQAIEAGVRSSFICLPIRRT